MNSPPRKCLGAKAHWFVCFIHSYPRAKARGNEFSTRATATTVKPLRGFFLFPFIIKPSSFTIHTRGGIGFELPRRGYSIKNPGPFENQGYTITATR